jgi:serine protease Do
MAVIAGAVMLIANSMQAQAMMQPPGMTSSASGVSRWVYRVADGTAGGAPSSFADLADKVVPAVIGVAAKVTANRKSLPGRSFGFGAPDEEDGSEHAIPMPDAPGRERTPGMSQQVTIGSGFFISPDGYAVTNSHVVGNSDTAEIRTNDGKTYSAKVIGRDAVSDLALIKAEGRNDFGFAKLADQPPRVGDWVLAAGNSFGLGGSVAAGIVSARERNIETASAQDFLQLDAAINKGDSGGPSFDTHGDVVGVNSMIFSPSGGSVGVAFAIPADTVKTVISQLKEKGAVTRGWMGAKLQSVTPDLADSLGVSNLQGALVADVQGDGPAAKAGLASGDVITSANGASIKNAAALVRNIRGMAPGSSVQLDLLRKGKQSSVSVTLGQMPDQQLSAPAGIQK